MWVSLRRERKRDVYKRQALMQLLLHKFDEQSNKFDEKFTNLNDKFEEQSVKSVSYTHLCWVVQVNAYI